MERCGADIVLPMLLRLLERSLLAIRGRRLRMVVCYSHDYSRRRRLLGSKVGANSGFRFPYSSGDVFQDVLFFEEAFNVVAAVDYQVRNLTH